MVKLGGLWALGGSCLDVDSESTKSVGGALFRHVAWRAGTRHSVRNVLHALVVSNNA